MTNHKPINPLSVPDASEPLSRAEKVEEDAVLVGAVAAGAARAVEVAGVVLVGLVVCPPLAVLAFLLVVPFLVVAISLGLLVAVLSTPYLLFHHFRRRDGDHLSLLAHRLRDASHAFLDLAPHRIVADARKLHSR
jgi:hypothetical protein